MSDNQQWRVLSWDDLDQAMQRDSGKELFFPEETGKLEERIQTLHLYLRSDMADLHKQAWEENLHALLEMYVQAGYRTGYRAGLKDAGDEK